DGCGQVTIIGTRNSYAKSYANANNISFKAINSDAVGDINRDGKVTIDDATVIQKAAADMVVLSDAQKTVADVDGDGRITVKDATCVQKYLAKYTSGTGSAGQYI
ncbi:MAG: dockerin type I repeat-containing protein, partial [Ruminococcus sp.]|nr:dockerin type I repeat-containing protein [Ruminococcus sp.]